MADLRKRGSNWPRCWRDAKSTTMPSRCCKGRSKASGSTAASRLTCATRQQLGSYLLDALDPDHAEYLKFHIEVVACPFCAANLADLQRKAEPSAPAARSRHKKIYDSSRGLLSGEG